MRKLIAMLAAVLAWSAPALTWAAKCKVLHNFGYGSVPSGSLLLDGNGNLYGGDYSATFKLIPQRSGKWKYVVLHKFATPDGSPWGALVRDRSGNLYGTTIGGPVSNSEVYELSHSSQGWNFTPLYADGAGPGLLMDGVGKLYGSIGLGDYIYYGAIAELSSGSGGWSYDDLYNFCTASGDCSNGFVLPAPPIWDGKGNMFGVTSEGGIGWGGKGNPPCWTNNGCGVIFEMTPNGDGTWSYHVLHRFASSKTDGQSPQGGLVMDAAGNFYGTTGGGGSHNDGLVFKLSPKAGGGWKMTVIYDFPQYCDNGCGPAGNLAFDKVGNLYGENGGGNGSCSGGHYFCGMIYKLTPQNDGTWKYSSVYKFHGPDGFGPLGVTLDGKGHIFGATTWGGKYNFGVAFEIAP